MITSHIFEIAPKWQKNAITCIRDLTKDQCRGCKTTSKALCTLIIITGWRFLNYVQISSQNVHLLFIPEGCNIHYFKTQCPIFVSHNRAVFLDLFLSLHGRVLTYRQQWFHFCWFKKTVPKPLQWFLLHNHVSVAGSVVDFSQIFSGFEESFNAAMYHG